MPFMLPGCNCSHIRLAANIYEFTYERTQVPRFRSITLGISYNYSSCNAMRRWATILLRNPCAFVYHLLLWYSFMDFSLSRLSIYALFTTNVPTHREAHLRCYQIKSASLYEFWWWIWAAVWIHFRFFLRVCLFIFIVSLESWTHFLFSLAHIVHNLFEAYSVSMHMHRHTNRPFRFILLLWLLHFTVTREQRLPTLFICLIIWCEARIW